MSVAPAGPTSGDFSHPPLFQVRQLPATGKELACTGMKLRKRVRQQTDHRDMTETLLKAA